MITGLTNRLTAEQGNTSEGYLGGLFALYQEQDSLSGMALLISHSDPVV